MLVHRTLHLAAVIALALTFLVSPSAAAPRVLLVGVDGGSWSVFDPLLAEGRMPNLAALIARGVHTKLETVEPVISPTVWSSVATGRRPEVHGIGDFFGDARDLAVPTIFERLAAQGMRVGVHEFLVTWPPQTLPKGFVVPGWLRIDDTTAPPDALVRAGGPGYRYDIRGLASRQAFHDEGFEELEKKAAQWNALAERFAIEAGAVSFYAIDALSHRFWIDSFPNDFEEAAIEPELHFEGTVQRAAIGFDRALGELVAAVPETTTFLIASDHGFQHNDGFRRVWSGHFDAILADAGLAEAEHAYSFEGQFAFTVLRVHAGEFAAQDALLDRLTEAFAGATNQEGTPLFRAERLDVAERPSGKERGWFERAKQWGLRQAARFLFSVEFDPDAHAYLVVMPQDDALEATWPDGRVTLGGATRPIREVLYADGFTGTHDPTGIFVAAGGPIVHRPERGESSVLEIAPLYAYLANGRIPDDLPAPLRREWIDPQRLSAEPPESIPAASIARLPAPEAPAGDDAELIERLRAMGYVE